MDGIYKGFATLIGVHEDTAESHVISGWHNFFYIILELADVQNKISI